MSDLYVEFKALEKTIDHSDSMTQLEGSMQFNLRARDAVSVTKTVPMFVAGVKHMMNEVARFFTVQNYSLLRSLVKCCKTESFMLK